MTYLVIIVKRFYPSILQITFLCGDYEIKSHNYEIKRQDSCGIDQRNVNQTLLGSRLFRLIVTTSVRLQINTNQLLGAQLSDWSFVFWSWLYSWVFVVCEFGAFHIEHEIPPVHLSCILLFDPHSSLCRTCGSFHFSHDCFSYHAGARCRSCLWFSGNKTQNIL